MDSEDGGLGAKLAAARAQLAATSAAGSAVSAKTDQRAANPDLPVEESKANKDIDLGVWGDELSLLETKAGQPAIDPEEENAVFEVDGDELPASAKSAVSTGDSNGQQSTSSGSSEKKETALKEQPSSTSDKEPQQTPDMEAMEAEEPKEAGLLQYDKLLGFGDLDGGAEDESWVERSFQLDPSDDQMDDEAPGVLDTDMDGSLIADAKKDEGFLRGVEIDLTEGMDAAAEDMLEDGMGAQGDDDEKAAAEDLLLWGRSSQEEDEDSGEEPEGRAEGTGAGQRGRGAQRRDAAAATRSAGGTLESADAEYAVNDELPENDVEAAADGEDEARVDEDEGYAEAEAIDGEYAALDYEGEVLDKE